MNNTQPKLTFIEEARLVRAAVDTFFEGLDMYPLIDGVAQELGITNSHDPRFSLLLYNINKKLELRAATALAKWRYRNSEDL
jgi:hypothetical protein